MSELAKVRAGIKTRLEGLGIRVHDKWEGDVVPPAAIVVPPARGPYVRYHTSNGTSDAIYAIILLVSKNTDRIAQEDLDKYVDTEGAKSVYAAFYGQPVTDAHYAEVIESRNYGTVRIGTGQTEQVREYLGVEFVLQVGLD